MDGDVPDATPSNRNLSNSGENPTQNDTPSPIWTSPTVDLNDMYYDMSGKKYLIILNHFKFKRTRHFCFRQPAMREGTDNDAIRLKQLYENLNFNVQRHDDLCRKKIFELFREFCKMNHRETACVIIAILTHGKKGDKVYAADRTYRLDDLTTMLENVPHLVGKPKLFYVQACRGEKEDSGKCVEVRGGDDDACVSTHADFLILYSTVNDHLSYRNIYGSWLVQALCEVIEAHHEDLDVLHLLTLLNQTLAYKYQTRSRFPARRNKKQVAETRSTLTKILKF